MEQIFIENPNLDHCYKTSDGKYFYGEDTAKNYAKNLEDKQVIKLVRMEEETPENSENTEVETTETLGGTAEVLEETTEALEEIIKVEEKVRPNPKQKK